MKTTLIEDGVLKETEGKLTIEPDTMYFLEICKFNDVVVKLEVKSEEQDIDVYHYISLEKAEFTILEGKRISSSKVHILLR